MSARSAAEIDHRTVVRRRADVASAEIDGEVVYAVGVDPDVFNGFDAHWLDPSAATIWRGFDGERSVGELAALIAEAFGLAEDEALDSVVGMARAFARAGAIEGFAAERPKPVVPSRPESLPLGAALPTFAFDDLSGDNHESGSLWADPTLLVHWSPSCTYCETIARELADIHDALTAAGVRIVVLTADTGDASAQLMARVGLEALVLRNPGYEPFLEVGTPSAYLVDAAGLVSSPLAIGSNEITDMARGLLEDGTEAW